MSEILQEVKELREIIFNMLNFTNIYALTLDEQMTIRYVNNSLAIDLGYNGYKELVGQCWLDYIEKNEIETVKKIHYLISNGIEGWEKFREVKNNIIGKNEKTINVYWFNSHINSEYNWTFSFGIRKKPAININKQTIDNVRNYYHDILTKDRIMINSMKDIISMRDKIVDTCKPNF